MKYNVVKPIKCSHSTYPTGHVFWTAENINNAFAQRAEFSNCYYASASGKNKDCVGCNMIVVEVDE